MVTYMKKLFGKLYKKIIKKNILWNEIEYFNPSWKQRVKNMSHYILPNESILDLGCGEMWLKEFIRHNNVYYPVDYKDRGKETIICNFNNYEYPEIETDVAFVSGCIEYIEDYNWFIDCIAKNHKKIIISYCILEDFKDKEERKKKAWVNHLSENELVNVVEKAGFSLVQKEYGYSTFYVFNKK